MYFRLVRHATIILGINKRKLLVDPVFSDKGSMEPAKPAESQNRNPLVELPVSGEMLTACDAVLVTHTHRDHFDEAAARLLPRDKQIFCQPRDRDKLLNYGFENVTAICRHINWEGMCIARTPARHGHGAAALMFAPVSGFVISATGESAVYITGDSIFYSATRKVLDRYKPDIVICNAGEATFSSGRPITMGIEDIAAIYRHSPASKIIAVHMESWNHCILTRKDLGRYVLENNMQDRIFIPRDGEEIAL
ncbi:MBL fold metallo-hydrolase [Ruminiclostridium cellobioparum]|uniref:MBL fold metallo-hydrolase n=1 Tax=Ruminiclostridium cellobioparum TaxID=29355 RepID=UPI00047FB978|nr:MBL fold metallo-hydrolase [Ruminiclostridium cellobioparum]